MPEKSKLSLTIAVTDVNLILVLINQLILFVSVGQMSFVNYLKIGLVCLSLLLHLVIIGILTSLSFVRDKSKLEILNNVMLSLSTFNFVSEFLIQNIKV